MHNHTRMWFASFVVQYPTCFQGKQVGYSFTVIFWMMIPPVMHFPGSLSPPPLATDPISLTRKTFRSTGGGIMVWAFFRTVSLCCKLSLVGEKVVPLMNTLVWLHGDSLSKTDPAASQYPKETGFLFLRFGCRGIVEKVDCIAGGDIFVEHQKYIIHTNNNKTRMI